MTAPCIGLALGSGAARGWAHVGVLRVLQEAGVRPDVICGTSVGAVVGAAYLTGQLDEFQTWARHFNLFGMLGMLDLTFSRGGLVAVQKAFERLRNAATDINIEQLPRPFAAVATDLSSGREIWLRDGPLLDAIQASAAMPGLFPAVRRDDMWLSDGALVNPVPVSLCRALGADVVIAVNLNNHRLPVPRLSRRARAALRATARGSAAKGAGTAATAEPDDDTSPEPPPAADAAAIPGNPISQITLQISQQIRARLSEFGRDPATDPPPTILDIVAGSIDIMQDRITRSRLAGEPPDVLIAPRLGQVGILEFDRGEELIAIGAMAARTMLPALELALKRP